MLSKAVQAFDQSTLGDAKLSKRVVLSGLRPLKTAAHPGTGRETRSMDVAETGRCGLPPEWLMQTENAKQRSRISVCSSLENCGTCPGRTWTITEYGIFNRLSAPRGEHDRPAKSPFAVGPHRAPRSTTEASSANATIPRGPAGSSQCAVMVAWQPARWYHSRSPGAASPVFSRLDAQQERGRPPWTSAWTENTH